MTAQNYKELTELYTKYNSKGLEILGFPCNDFGGQEPGSNAEVAAFAKAKGARWPVLGKIDCEAKEQTAPLYQYMKSAQKGPLGIESLAWNFAKILCDKDGVPIKRFPPTSSPLSFEADIAKLCN